MRAGRIATTGALTSPIGASGSGEAAAEKDETGTCAMAARERVVSVAKSWQSTTGRPAGAQTGDAPEYKAVRPCESMTALHRSAG